MTRPLTEAQQAYARSGTVGMSKNALRAKQQIASQRTYVYDGALRPTCVTCGHPRQNRRLLKCDSCEALA